MNLALLLMFLGLVSCSAAPSPVIEQETNDDFALTAPLAGTETAAIVAVTPEGELCAMHPQTGAELARTPAGAVDALGSGVISRTLWAVSPSSGHAAGHLARFELGERSFTMRRTLPFDGQNGALATVDPVPVGFSFDEGTTLFRGATTFLPWSRPSSAVVVPSREGPRLLALVDSETPWILTSATIRTDGLSPRPDAVIAGVEGGSSARLVVRGGAPHIVAMRGSEIWLTRDGVAIARTGAGEGVDLEDAIEADGTVVALLGPTATLVRLDGSAPPLRLDAVIGHTPWPTRRLVRDGSHIWVAADTRALVVEADGGRLDTTHRALPCQATRITLLRGPR